MKDFSRFSSVMIYRSEKQFSFPEFLLFIRQHFVCLPNAAREAFSLSIERAFREWKFVVSSEGGSAKGIKGALIDFELMLIRRYAIT